MGRLALATLTLALGACTTETSLHVVVGGDLRPGGDFDEVEVTMSLLGAVLWEARYPVSSADALPLDYDIAQPSKGTQVVDVTARASLAGRRVVEASRLTAFASGRRVDVPFCLWSRCIGSLEPECLEGRCDRFWEGRDAGADGQDASRDADRGVEGDADLDTAADADEGQDADVDAADGAGPDSTPDAGRDADEADGPDGTVDADRDADRDSGPDADRDVAPCPDACNGGCVGGVCVVSSPREDVLCPSGIPCRIDCLGGSACAVALDCGEATTCQINCMGGASCSGPITCGESACTVQCGGTGSGSMCNGGITCGPGPCTINCVGGGSCQLSPVVCEGSCACDVRCTGGRSCEAGVTCPDGCDLVTDDGCTSFPPGCDTCP